MNPATVALAVFAKVTNVPHLLDVMLYCGVPLQSSKPGSEYLLPRSQLRSPTRSTAAKGGDHEPPLTSMWQHIEGLEPVTVTHVACGDLFGAILTSKHTSSTSQNTASLHILSSCCMATRKSSGKCCLPCATNVVVTPWCFRLRVIVVSDPSLVYVQLWVGYLSAWLS